MKKKLLLALYTLIAAASTPLFVGCEDQDSPAEEAGETVEETTEEISDEVDDATTN